MSDTRLESFLKIQPELKGLQTMVYRYIEERHGAASFEVADYFHRPFHVIAPRVTELVQQGLLKDSGVRVWNASTRRRVVRWIVNGEHG